MSYKGWKQKDGLYTNPAYPGWEISRDFLGRRTVWRTWLNGAPMGVVNSTLRWAIASIQQLTAPQEVKQP